MRRERELQYMGTIPEIREGDELAPQTVQYGRTPRWMWDVLRGEHKAISLYGYLSAYYGGRGGIFPGQDTIATHMGISVRDVQRALAALRKSGAISIRRRRNRTGQLAGNVYVLAWDAPHPPPVAGGADQDDHDVSAGEDQPPNTSGDHPPPVAAPNQTVPQGVIQTALQENQTPPPPPVVKAEDARSARAIQEGEEIQDKPHTDPAAQFLMDLEPPWRLGPIDAAALAPRLALVAAARGWEPDRHLATALTDNPGGIRNYATVLRTRIENLPMRHVRPAPAADRVCMDCGRPHPNLYDNGVCPNCIRTDDPAPPPVNLRDLIQPTTGHPKP